MPSASPLLSCPNAVSELDYGYRHLHAYPCPTPPPPGPRLQSDYDPFKFLSAMTEQSLTGNFASHHHHHTSSAHASQAAQGGGNHFLFAPSSHLPPPPSQNGFSSPPAMTSSPTQYYGSSQTPTSSMCCLYGGSGSQYSSPSGSDFGGDSFSLQQPPLPVHHSPSQPLHQQPHGQGDGESRGAVKSGLTTPTAKKSFLCSTDLMDTCEEEEAMLSWTRQHPEHWTRTEVLDWLFSVAQERGLDMQELRGEAFQSLTGAQLCSMDLPDFTRLEPNYGHVLYQLFKKLLAGVHFSKPCGESPTGGPAPSHNIPQGGAECTELRPAFSSMSCDSSRDSQEASPVFHNFSTVRKASCPELLPHPDGYWKQERLDWKPERSQSLQSDVLDIDSYDFDVLDPPSLSGHTALEACPTDYDGYTPTFSGSGPIIRNSCFYPPCPYPPPLPRRRPGRPRVKSLPEDDERSCKEKKAKNQHLWEFIYETLLNPLYNPQYLRWENQREGVFRFVQSEAVAQLWGSRKNNENMTYEKLSRAMRHYYKRGILERVEGRRLVYKFSRKAMDRVREIREKRLPSV